MLDALDHFRVVLNETKMMRQLIVINIGVTPVPFDFGTGGIWHEGHALDAFFNPTTIPQSKLLIADVPTD